MRKNLFALLLFVSLLAPGFALAQAPVRITPAERRIAETITADKLSNWLHFVASDAMAGRDTPSQGLDVTAEFLKMNLSRWGFKPAGDNGTFFQKMALRRDGINAAETFVTVNGQKFDYGVDLVRVSGTDTGTMSPKIVFAGNGWMVKSKNLNPYAGIDVRGKIIAVYGEGQIGGRNLVPLPAGVTQADLTGERGTDWADAVTYARNNGAAGVMVLASSFLNDNWGAVVQNFGRSRTVVDKLQPAVANQGGAPQPTVFIASRKLTEAIFAGEAGNPVAGAANSFEVGKNFSLSIALKPEIVHTQNVVALWEGGDPTLKKEMVAIGAHYDHVGTNPNAPGEDKIWNGADDDGSGTVALLAMAEALAVSKVRPKRSVLFVWHAGEEKGLWGAEYFNKFPTVDIKNVIAQLNIDMIGRSKKPGDTNPRNKDLAGPNEVYVIGSEMMSSTLGAITKGTNNGFLKLDYNYKYDDPKDTNRFFFRSDHFHYAVNGIPIAFWFTGVHEDYHQPSDHPDKIDYAKYEKITRTIFLTMWELTDLRERPKVDKDLPPELRER
ncbi:MAG: M20/M25/M40 family metallo-hydrolase [Acidobacteria bacterium]|nr:M20/M25/M40 family metallo-hydrolase [Acidobacteriota bacterium]